MFGKETHTPKTFEPRPTRTISIAEVLTPVPELGTQEPYHESYFWWINPENTVTLEDITALYQYQYGENFTYHTPTEKFKLHLVHPVPRRRSALESAL